MWHQLSRERRSGGGLSISFPRGHGNPSPRQAARVRPCRVPVCHDVSKLGRHHDQAEQRDGEGVRSVLGTRHYPEINFKILFDPSHYLAVPPGGTV